MKVSVHWLSIIFGFVAPLSFSASIYELQSSAEPYIQFVLPKEIFSFATLRQGDYGLSLANFSIVDNQGQALPYAIYRQPRPELSTKNEFVQFPVYRVEEAVSEPIKQSGTEIHIQGDRIDISAAADVTQDSTGKSIYIVDLRAQDKKIDAFQIDWLEEGASIKQWQLEASIDFQHWNYLGKYDLVKVENAATPLVQNTIHLTLSPKQYHFLRFTPLGAHSESITRIQGIINNTVNSASPKTEHWIVNGNFLGTQSSASRYRSEKVRAWEFTRSEQIPALSLALSLGDAAYAGNASFFAKQEQKDPWRPVYSGYWVNAQVGNEWKMTAPIELQNNAIRYWRLELDESANLTSVTLDFAWEPLIIRVIGNNKSPFRIQDQPFPAVDPQKLYHQLIGTDEKHWNFVALTQISIHPFMPVPEKANWPLLVFWFGISLVVGFLAFFSVKLFKQIQQKSN